MLKKMCKGEIFWNFFEKIEYFEKCLAKGALNYYFKNLPGKTGEADLPDPGCSRLDPDRSTEVWKCLSLFQTVLKLEISNIIILEDTSYNVAISFSYKSSSQTPSPQNHPPSFPTQPQPSPAPPGRAPTIPFKRIGHFLENMKFA